MNKKNWVIVSYFSNMNSAPASIHCDDRLRPLIEEGIEIDLVSSMMGERYKEFRHQRLFSLSPAGFRYELRHITKRKIKNKFLSLCVFFFIFFPFFPFYFIECLLIRNKWLQLDLSWSWGITGGLWGAWVARKNNVDLIYSTGGSVSSQTAGFIASRLSGKPWIAEMQDPLTYQYNPKRLKELMFNLWLEKRMIRQARFFIFLTKGAAQAAANRNANYTDKIKTIRPGLKPVENLRFQGNVDALRFMHLGTLDGSRHLEGFLGGAQCVLKDDASSWHLDLYGHIGKGVKIQMEQFAYRDRITWHGKISREKSIELMQSGAVLVLIQNASSVSSETIPSKVYEYLQVRRLIFGLIYKNEELKELLLAHGHIVADIDHVEDIALALKEIIRRFKEGCLHKNIQPYCYNVKDAIQHLIHLGNLAMDTGE